MHNRDWLKSLISGWSILAPALLALVLSGCRPAGNIVWQRRYDSGREDFGRAIAADGTDIVVGGSWRDTTGAQIVIDWRILRYDGKGNLLWRRIYDSGKPDWLSDIAIDGRHNIIAVGWAAAEDNDSTRLLLVKFNPQGEVIWDRQYAVGLAAQGQSLVLEPSGNIIVCGSTFAGPDSADDDLLILRVNDTGDVVGSDTLDFGADENGQDMARDRQGNLVIVGGQVPLPDSLDSVSTADVLVVKLSPEHKLLWRRVYDSGGDDLTGSVAIDSLGNSFVAVSTLDDQGGGTRLLEYSPKGGLLLDKQYTGQFNPSCLALAVDHSGSVLGCGAAGPDDVQYFVGFRYQNNWFSEFLVPRGYRHGVNDLANALVVDADNDIILTGVSDPGVDPDILTLKLHNIAPHGTTTDKKH